jgi:hypothetical protein
MRKAVTTLLVTVIILSVMGVTVAAAASTTYATDKEPTQITITQRPKKVMVGEIVKITGRLTSGGNGLYNKSIYHSSKTGNEWWFLRTNADGSFTDEFHYKLPSLQYVQYSFFGDDQYASCTSDTIEITVVQPT